MVCAKLIQTCTLSQQVGFIEFVIAPLFNEFLQVCRWGICETKCCSGGHESKVMILLTLMSFLPTQIFPELRHDLGSNLVTNRDRFEQNWYKYCREEQGQSDEEVRTTQSPTASQVSSTTTASNEATGAVKLTSMACCVCVCGCVDSTGANAQGKKCRASCGFLEEEQVSVVHIGQTQHQLMQIVKLNTLEILITIAPVQSYHCGHQVMRQSHKINETLTTLNPRIHHLCFGGHKIAQVSLNSSCA